MSGRRCFLNTRHALYRVFVSPIECNEAVPRRALPSTLRQSPWSSRQNGLLLPLSSAQQKRSFVRAPRPFRGRRADPRQADDAGADSPDGDERRQRLDTRYTTRETIERSGRDRMPRDHEITDPKIMVLDGGSVEGPLQTQFVLSKLEPTESLRMIEPFHPGIPEEEGGRPSYALCKVVNKREEYEHEKLRKERKRIAGGKPKTKEVELGWAIGAHDLATKMRQIGGFLEKGMKVEVVLGKKKKSRPATQDEMKTLLKAIRAEVEARGARESKPEEGTLGVTMRLYFEKVSKNGTPPSTEE